MLSRRTFLLGLPLAGTARLLQPRRGIATEASGGHAQERTVTTVAELAKALVNAGPGERIVLDDGEYALDELVVSTRGQVEIRAREPLAARLTGRLILRSPDASLSGLEIGGGQVVVAADRVSISRSRFLDTDRIALVVKNGRDVTVERCAFERCRGRGISIDAAGKDGTVVAPQIRRNLFRDFVGEPRDNGHEAIQLGQFGNHALRRLGAVVEQNLFINVGIDSETISVKSSDNIIRANTFLDCRSRPTNRFGNDNVWESNWIENCFGLWIYGANHRLVGNRVFGGRGDGIAIMAGNTAPDDVRKEGTRSGGKKKDFRPFCLDVLVEGNSADRLTVGMVAQQFGDVYDMPARGTRVAAHNGPVDLELEVDTVMLAQAKARSQPATKLTVAEVGPASA